MKGKKTGGRQKGTPNKASADAREAAQELLDSTAYRCELKRRLETGKLPPAVEAMLWYYAYGKPKETIGMETDILPKITVKFI